MIRTATTFGPRRPGKVLVLAAAVSLLSACSSMDRLSSIGQTPPLTPIQNPATAPGYQPVSLPMPAPAQGEREANSLWRAGARAFFRDQRANRVGDILTITIQINDKAQIQNQSQRTRNGKENMGIPGLFGLQRNIARVLPTPDNDTLESLVKTTADSSSVGTGSIGRSEQINMQVAALITQVLPNGNLVVQGKQEVRVNYEVRELTINGIIRPEDITSQNTISYEKIAEARISYGGRGHISDVQQPRWGQQVFDIVAPF
ncbi:flagellar basal body L-ring protein FlgH [Rhodocista pekingensis]|uniref:Flagellar L-ring protein n=1 Tax=Rhodocista pekingensis TaxID=201185 RepID=A0ABW2KQG2_9PROT